MSPLERIANVVTKERFLYYCGSVALVSLLGYLAHLFTGEGLLDHFGKVLGTDFIAFYTGGNFFINGTLEKAYHYLPNGTFPEQLSFQVSIAGENLKEHHPFVSPPFAALIFAPFSTLDYLTAYAAWMTLCLVLLATSIHLLMKEYYPLRDTSTVNLFLGCFLFFPTIGWLIYGQVTPLILFIYTTTFLALRKNRDFLAGFYLGLLAFKPQLAFPLALVLIIKGRWHAVAGGIISLGLWITVGLIYSPEAMLAYVDFSPKLFDLLRSDTYPTWGIHSIFGFSSLLFYNISPALSEIIYILLTCLLILFLLRLWWRTKWQPATKRWDLTIAASFSWGLIISPHLFTYDLMLLLLPFAIVWFYQKETPSAATTQLLGWTSILWALSFFGGYLSLSQLTITAFLGINTFAIQATTIVIFIWGYNVFKLAQNTNCVNDKPRSTTGSFIMNSNTSNTGIDNT